MAAKNPRGASTKITINATLRTKSIAPSATNTNIRVSCKIRMVACQKNCITSIFGLFCSPVGVALITCVSVLNAWLSMPKLARYPMEVTPFQSIFVASGVMVVVSVIEFIRRMVAILLDTGVMRLINVRAKTLDESTMVVAITKLKLIRSATIISFGRSCFAP